MQLLPRDSLHITNETPQQKKIFTVKNQIWREMYTDVDYGAVNIKILFAGCVLYTYLQIISTMFLFSFLFFFCFLT